MRRKVCVITGSRAEYGLLYWLMKEIQSDPDFELQIIATGMHLAPEFGLTIKEIEKEFRVDKKIEMLLSSDTPEGISKSMGLGLISFSEVYEELKPDIIIVLGDRFEIFSAVVSAMFKLIPIAHLHGGEITEGAVDDMIRHSITKMSHIHFTSTEVYRKRVIQLGEEPDRVFNVGAIGLENIRRLALFSKDDFEKTINFKLNKYNLLITFHPVTLEAKFAKIQFNNLLEALNELSDTNLIFTKSNADTCGRTINEMIDDYVNKNPEKAITFINMGQRLYLSAMKYVDAVVGNSSSGIIEAPSFKIGTIDIGNRQKGRIKADSIINCRPNKVDILSAFKTLYSDGFQKKIQSIKNPCGNGYTALRIKEILKKIDLNNISKKRFHDLEYKL